MAAKLASPVYFVILVLYCKMTVATNEAGNKTVSSDNLSTKSQELMKTYRNSIIYWDTKHEETRQVILKELAVEETPPVTRFPGCPKIRYPLICDSDGILLENTCYFRMRRGLKSNILPIMVFTTTDFEFAKTKCIREVKKP